MASGRRSVKQELFTNTTKRPTAIEITDSKSVIPINTTKKEVEKKSESNSSSSDSESKSDLLECINKLEEKNQLLEEELTNIQRLTTSLPNSLLTVIFPNTQHSNIIKEELGCIIQDFCNRKREELNIKDEVKTPTKSDDQVMSCVEYNDLYSMERYPDIPTKTPTTTPNKLPKYSQIYNRIVEPKSNKPLQPNSNEILLVKPLLRLDSFNRPSRSCFNCGGNHTVKDCKEIKDFNKIRANKQEFINAQGGEQHNRNPRSDQDNSSSETRPRDRREHYHYPPSPNIRERDQYFHRSHPDNMSREETGNYSNSRYSRESSRDREGRAYHYSRYPAHNYYNEKDNRNSYHNSRSDRDVHIRMSSTPSKGSPRDVRMVDYRSKVEYSSTYGDMELSDQELEDGEIINLSPRQSFHSQPPLPPAYPPFFTPPLPHPDTYAPYFHTPPSTRDARAHIELRKESHFSQSMPDVRIGAKRRYPRRSPEASYNNKESYIESSSDSSSVFKTNEHNFSLDFPPGIVTPESMRAPERFNKIRRIIDRRK